MTRKRLAGKRYFYSIGQRARALGWTKGQAETYYHIDKCLDYARIAFDAGFRGL